MLGAQIAETVVLGWIGTDALAALGYAFPTTILLYSFAGGIGAGASSVTARTFGAGHRTRVRAIVTHAHLLALVVGIAVSAMFAAYAWHIVGLLGATGDVRQMATDYLTVFAIGFPLFMISMVGSMLLRATGNAASPGVVMAIGSLGQIVLCPILVFGWLGAPELGIAGAAWAYVIARGLGSGAYLVLITRAHLFRWTLHGLTQSIFAIMHVGGPAVASGLVMPFSMFVITRLLSSHGDAVVAGYNVASRVEMLAHMILWSASSSLEPFVGQNWGAGLVNRVRRALKLTNNFALAWGVVTFVVMVTCGEWVVTTWISQDPVVIEVSVWFFTIIPLSIGFMGMTQIASSSFNALGKPGPSVVISLLRTWLVYVPLALLGDYFFGYIGIFIATAVSNVAVGLVAWNWNAGYVRRAAKGAANPTDS